MKVIQADCVHLRQQVTCQQQQFYSVVVAMMAFEQTQKPLLEHQWLATIKPDLGDGILEEALPKVASEFRIWQPQYRQSQQDYGVQIDQINTTLKANDEKKLKQGWHPMPWQHPQRQTLLGTTDQHYQQSIFPALADDYQWEFGQTVATPLQQEQAFKPGDRIKLSGFYDDTKVISLPPYVARLMLQYQNQALQEQPMHFDTISWFPRADILVVHYRAVFPVGDIAAQQLEAIMVALDHVKPAKQRPLNHYQAVYQQRQGKQAALAQLQQNDLLPKDDEGDQASATQPLQLSAKQQRQWQQIAQQQDLHWQQVQRFCQAHQLDCPVEEPEPLAHPLANVQVSMPPASPEVLVDQVKALLSECKPAALVAELPHVHEYFPELHEAFPSMADEAKDVKNNTRIDQAKSKQIRQWLASGQRDAKGMSFANTDLSDCQFEQIDCQGCDFSGAILQRCRFINCRLDKSCWKQAEVSVSQFEDLDFHQVDLTEAQFTRCQYQQVKHQASRCDQTRWLHCDFNAGSWQDMQLYRCHLHANQYHDQQWQRLNLVETHPQQCQFIQCRLSHSHWSLIQISDCQWQHCHFERMWFADSQWYRCKIQESQAQGFACAGDQSVLSHCHFHAMDCFEANFQDVYCYQCHWQACDWKGACFLDASLDLCTLQHCSLREANIALSQWLRCQLETVLLFQANAIGVKRWQCQDDNVNWTQAQLAYMEQY